MSRRFESTLHASLGAILACGCWAGLCSAGESVAPHDPNLLTRLASAKQVVVQRIAGPPADSCRPDLVTPSDTIACYPATSVRKAPGGTWTRQLVNLMSHCTWVRGRRGLDAQFAPAIGIRFQDASLNVDWILSLVPPFVLSRTDGIPSASAAIPETDRVAFLNMLQLAFPSDSVLSLLRWKENERRTEAELGKQGGLPPAWETTCGCERAPWDRQGEGEFVYYEVAPAPIDSPPAEYPEEARSMKPKPEGTVTLHVQVDRLGKVCRIKLMRGIEGLNDAAIQAVAQWRFKPALSNEKPVCVWVEVPVKFAL